MINSFKEKYAFLSNFYPVAIVHDGLTYQSVEAAYQAAKCANVDDRYYFTKLSAPEAKRAGRQVALRSDWEQVKVAVMRQLLIVKFLGNPAMGQLLLMTGNEDLVEGNTWNDRFWGVCNGIGENNLGKLLMEIRENLSGWGHEKKKVEIDIKAATGLERLYAVGNTTEVCFKSAFVGVITGTFDACGNPVCKSMDDFNRRRANEYIKEREGLYVSLCNGVLSGVASMKSFCEAHPEAMMTPGAYAFRTDQGEIAAVIRLSVAPSVQSEEAAEFHIYFYEKKWLDKHLENSKNGVTIRFYGPENKELHVPENGKITIVGSAGDDNALEYVVRYIDASHFELQRNRFSQIYHVAEFADFVSRNGIAVKVTE